VSDFREEALGALYAADAAGATEVDVEGLTAKARRLASGAWAHRREIDHLLGEVSTGWRVERMPAVDRSVLRLAAYELIHTSVPTGVVLSEAVEMAKRFSTAESGRFVNGVLATVARRVRPPEAEGAGGAATLPDDSPF